MQKYRIENTSHPLKASLIVEVCDQFFTQLLGLMFKKSLPVDQGLYFAGTHENQLDSAIHMFFMNFDIAVVWLNSNHQVVDIQIARRWPPIYFPHAPARFFLEIHASRFSEFQLGDQLVLENA